MQDGEVGLVDAVHVAGDHVRRDGRRIAIPDVEHMVRFVLVRTDEITLHERTFTYCSDVLHSQTLK